MNGYNWLFIQMAVDQEPAAGALLERACGKR
jgi:hypothetical protein